MLSLLAILACAPAGHDDPQNAAVYGDPSQLALTGADFVFEAHNGIDSQIFDAYNSTHGTNYMSLYDSGWGTSVSINKYNILIAVGSDGLISSIRAYGVTGSVTIPAGGYVAAANGASLPYLSHLAVGDEFIVHPATECTPSAYIGVQVVLYHNPTSQADLQAQLAAIDAAVYNTITLDDMRGYLNGSIGYYQANPDPCDDTPRLPEKPLFIAFDDGYANQIAWAPALLAKYDMVATFFIITSYPGSTSTWATWSQIDAAHDTYPDNVELACHSHAAHVQISGVAKYLTMTDTQVLSDMATCQDTLNTNTGVDTTALAWPFGSHTDHLIELGRKAGFDIMFSVWPGVNVPGNDDPAGEARRLGLSTGTPWSTNETLLNRWYVCE